MLLFKVKTQDAYTIKICVELLQHNIKTGCFVVDNDGIRLCMFDHNRKVLINLELERENFIMYKFKAATKMILGINLKHFHQMLKSIKKKDSMVLFINSDEPTDLGIKVIPKENNRKTTSFIKIQNIQSLDIMIPTGYDGHVIVPSSEFQKICKDFSSISPVIEIASDRNFYVNFSCAAKGIMNRVVEFGEYDDSDDEDDDDEKKKEFESYCHAFNTEQLNKITKISGLSSNMHVFVKKNLPLLIRAQIGQLGKIAIYIKSISQLEHESCEVDEDEDEEPEAAAVEVVVKPVVKAAKAVKAKKKKRA
jgi:proliferating cell nuclear antigen PCNA